MLSYPDFKHPKQLDEYLEVAKWKMNVITSFYHRFAKKPLIGGQIDAFMFYPKGGGQ